MADFLLLMHGDATGDVGDWVPYIGRLAASGRLQGGSAIGPGRCVRKTGAVPPTTGHITGFMHITADSLEEARTLLPGNPVFEAGGTVEIRALPITP